MGILAIIGLVIQVLQLLAKLPGLIDSFQEIFGKWQTLRPLQAWKEVVKLKAAIEETQAQGELALAATSPLLAYKADLSSRYQNIA